jgi:hypothetical protein
MCWDVPTVILLILKKPRIWRHQSVVHVVGFVLKLESPMCMYIYKQNTNIAKFRNKTRYV